MSKWAVVWAQRLVMTLSLIVLMCLFGCRLNKSNRAISTICTNLFIDKGKGDNLKQDKPYLLTFKNQTDLISRVPNNLLYYIHNFSLTYLPYAKI